MFVNNLNKGKYKKFTLSTMFKKKKSSGTSTILCMYRVRLNNIRKVVIAAVK